jgi:hypothetical protein
MQPREVPARTSHSGCPEALPIRQHEWRVCGLVLNELIWLPTRYCAQAAAFRCDSRLFCAGLFCYQSSPQTVHSVMPRFDSIDPALHLSVRQVSSADVGCACIVRRFGYWLDLFMVIWQQPASNSPDRTQSSTRRSLYAYMAWPKTSTRCGSLPPQVT